VVNQEKEILNARLALSRPVKICQLLSETMKKPSNRCQ